MSNKTSKSQATETVALVPFQVKTREEVRQKMKRIAEKNGLSLNDVASMCLAAGIPMVETKLREIHEPQEQAA